MAYSMSCLHKLATELHCGLRTLLSVVYKSTTVLLWSLLLVAVTQIGFFLSQRLKHGSRTNKILECDWPRWGCLIEEVIPGSYCSTCSSVLAVYWSCLCLLIGVCAHVLVFDLINSVGHCLLIYSSNKEKDMVGELLPRLRCFFSEK